MSNLQAVNSLELYNDQINFLGKQPTFYADNAQVPASIISNSSNLNDVSQNQFNICANDQQDSVKNEFIKTEDQYNFNYNKLPTTLDEFENLPPWNFYEDQMRNLLPLYNYCD